MDITAVGLLFSYLTGIAANASTNVIGNMFRKKLDGDPDALRACRDTESLREQLRLTGTHAARAALNTGPLEQSIFDLLTDEVFQMDIVQWLTAWKPEEKKKAEALLVEPMAKALEKGGADGAKIDDFKKNYFQRVEEVVFKDPRLAEWRLNLGLNALLEENLRLEASITYEGKETRAEIGKQHEETRRRIQDIVMETVRLQSGQFTAQQLEEAEARYRTLALESCDIIDLANLPEGDRHIAARARELELRRLYVPLRVRVESAAGRELNEDDLATIEEMRKQTQRRGYENNKKKNRASVGERLGQSRRLVLLGDPGAGKTTLVRWLATAYLLRLSGDTAYKNLPDVQTLPDHDWLPVVVRCRDLDESCTAGSIDDVLCRTFRKAHMDTGQSAALQAVVRQRLAEGTALLLIDGLDEITGVSLRARFSRQVEQLHIAFPQAPMVVTSRIVGYREMGYRIGRGFEHTTAADFSKEDKDFFARQWCDVTEPPERAEKAAAELIAAIHSSDRIERLTGNPMLLTTLALVKRKVGKLPNRRADLYWEAVLVLLNWRSEVDEPIDRHEAVPQLEYVAYEMCRRGVQQLREDEILDLLARMREEFPNVRTVGNHTPEEFLHLLERRTGILTEAGETRHLGRPVPVFEFRHLTFQEYLAALALVDGRYPGRDRNRSLAEHIAPLAGQTEEIETGWMWITKEHVVKENWREVLRLCAACCRDDDVDAVLKAIVTPLDNEDTGQTARPRAVLATLCLADEPNIGGGTALDILRTFARQAGEEDGKDAEERTAVDSAALEIAASVWNQPLHSALIEEFFKREPHVRANPGGLCAAMGGASAPGDDNKRREWLEEKVKKLHPGNGPNAVDAALTFMNMAYRKKIQRIPGMVEGLLAMLDRDGPSAHAGAWALYWFAGKGLWKPSSKEIEKLLAFIFTPSSDKEAVRLSIDILPMAKAPHAVEPIIARLEEEHDEVRGAAAEVLGKIGDPRAVGPLIAKLGDESPGVRKSALGALARLREDKTDRELLLESFRGDSPWLDPRYPVDERRVAAAAERLGLPKNEVRQRYEELAEEYNLKLTWKKEERIIN